MIPYRRGVLTIYKSWLSTTVALTVFAKAQKYTHGGLCVVPSQSLLNLTGPTLSQPKMLQDKRAIHLYQGAWLGDVIPLGIIHADLS